MARLAHRALTFIVCAVFAFLLTFVDAARQNSDRTEMLAANTGLVEKLGLTDLCLFTEARYTRHPSQADLHSAFQDHPMGLEHFPSGSLMPPPRGLAATYENLDTKTASTD